MMYMLNGLEMPLYTSNVNSDDIIEQFENQLEFKQNTSFKQMINSMQTYSHEEWPSYVHNLIEFCD